MRLLFTNRARFALLWVMLAAHAGADTSYIIPEQFGLGNSLIRAAIRPGHGDTYAVGRYYNGFNYRGLIAAYNGNGAPDPSFAQRSGLNGKLSFDFAGLGLENTCMAITQVYDGMVAACRAVTSSGLYDTYLVKFDSNGNLDTNFNSTGIMTSGLQTSSSKSVLVRGLAWMDGVGAHHGVVALVGAIVDYSGDGNFHPYIITYDQQTGAVAQSATIVSGLTGTAVGVTTDGTYFYVAATEMTEPYLVHVYRFNSSLVSSGGNWGNRLDIASAGGAGSDLPSSIVIGTSGLVVGGGDNSGGSSKWACMIAHVNLSTGLLDTSSGHDSLTGASNHDNQGVFLFSHDSGSPLTKSCIVNSVSAYEDYFVGTAHNGTNYDYLLGQINLGGTSGPALLTTKSGGTKDDVFYSVTVDDVLEQPFAAGRQDGATYSGPAVAMYFTDGSTPTLVTNTWVSSGTTGTAPSVRRDSTLVSDGTKAYVIGGWNGTTDYDDIAIYDPIANNWTSSGTSITTGGPGRGTAAIYENGKIIFFGGLKGSNTPTANGAVYDISGGTFTALNPSGKPSARYGHTGVWTGSLFLVWGGYDGSGSVGDGAMYDPAGDSWTDIVFDGNSPAERHYHSAVWTGTRMIVFGGYSSFNSVELNDGAIFDPTNGSNGAWTAMSFVSGASARQKHTAAWTGTYMLIYGGISSGSYALGAYGYNPESDTWVSGNTANEPQNTGTKPVWTGSQLLVWGGNSSGTRVNTGYAFTPATNSWAAMTSTNAPAARDQYGATYAGSGMVIFGGYNGTSNLNSVATYFTQGLSP